MAKDWIRQLEEKSALSDAALEDFLKAPTDPAVENLHDGALYALGLDQADPALRGKRIRPALCLIVCEALGGPPQAAMPFAIAVELMHNLFLVYDDIQDGDQFRRGRESLWARFGLEHAVNIAGSLYAKVFAALLSGESDALDPSLRFDLLRLLVETLEHTFAGQAQEMNARRRRDITVDHYLEIAGNKTGYYLSAPMIGGAMIAGAQAETLSAIRGLGRHVGPVFQIIDDIIDLTEGKGRDSVGCDIREGKRSFLVAHVAAKAGEGERDELFRILDLPRDETSSADIEWAAALFEKHGALEAGRALCRDLVEKGRSEISRSPAPLRDALAGIFEGLLGRTR